MKRIAVLRHAKSSSAEAGMDDFDRPLNDRGRADAMLVGRALAQRSIRFDRVIASPAQRVRQTLERLGAGYGEPLDVTFDPPLYGAGSADWLEVIRALPESVAAPLLAGHNPSLHELVLGLTDRDEAGLRDQVRGQYPTGALALIELPAERWAEIRPGCGKIVDLILPRSLAADA